MTGQIENFRNELVIDHTQYGYPCRLVCVVGKRRLEDPTSSYYAFVLKGECDIHHAGQKLTLAANMYFALPGGCEVDARGELVVIQRFGYRTLPTFGGPTEPDGRLSYIDNARASILIHPARLGDPVLNLLVFPPSIDQTVHLHPTTRFGCVIDGRGTCVTSTAKVPLEKGMVFALEPFMMHSFQSGLKGLKVIAFHPDSDVGATDEQHPMKTRTYLVK